MGELDAYVRASCRVDLAPEQQVDAVDLGNSAPARITGATFTWDGVKFKVSDVRSYRVKKDGTVGTASGGVWDFRVKVELFDPEIVAAAKVAIREALIKAEREL